eukprot:CAMPEP_0180517548 /NCGR_PEP_ID=MMETSP1036_2-20121128/54591_1 /TAXON_ID=632150 /ORGANISM="Azadinium spinosum, Strain 3D9" /LENGTH=189 /DNA_ID=CAMNT_0022529583 /DNA_START=72 /DNA_END=638 /DNA_ORIENTATION=-
MSDALTPRSCLDYGWRTARTSEGNHANASLGKKRAQKTTRATSATRMKTSTARKVHEGRPSASNASGRLPFSSAAFTRSRFSRSACTAASVASADAGSSCTAAATGRRPRHEAALPAEETKPARGSETKTCGIERVPFLGSSKCSAKMLPKVNNVARAVRLAALAPTGNAWAPTPMWCRPPLLCAMGSG